MCMTPILVMQKHAKNFQEDNWVSLGHGSKRKPRPPAKKINNYKNIFGRLLPSVMKHIGILGKNASKGEWAFCLLKTCERDSSNLAPQSLTGEAYTQALSRSEGMSESPGACQNPQAMPKKKTKHAFWAQCKCRSNSKKNTLLRNKTTTSDAPPQPALTWKGSQTGLRRPWAHRRHTCRQRGGWCAWSVPAASSTFVETHATSLKTGADQVPAQQTVWSFLDSWFCASSGHTTTVQES